MFQFIKENKLATAIIIMMITLVVALCTGFVTHYPELSLAFTLVGLVVAFTGFYRQVMHPRSSE